VAQHAQLTKRPWAAFTALLGFGMLAVYVAVIVAEGNNSIAEIAPWALLMAIPTILAFASVLMRDVRVARGLLIGAAALFGIVGALGILTIGIGFLLAAAAAVIATIRLSS
jgi:hypothetical protein